MSGPFPRGFNPPRHCRFCHKLCATQELVKYGERHWAHGVCLLKAKGLDFVNALPIGQLLKLPVGLMRDAGVPDKVIDQWIERVRADRAEIEAREKAREKAAADGRAKNRRFGHVSTRRSWP